MSIGRRGLWSILVIVSGSCGPAAAQDQPEATSQSAATQPAATQPEATTPDPLRSPRSMIREFLLAVGEAEKTPERINDAVACLDLSRIDEAQRSEQAPLLATQLERVLEMTFDLRGKTTDAAPEQPEGREYEFHAEGEHRITLVRGDDDRWRFSAETLAALPDLTAALQPESEAKQKEQVAAQQKLPLVRPQFRSARAAIETFINAQQEADKATASECLDLSGLSALELTARDEIGQDRADELMYVMDRIEKVVYPDIPDDPAGPPFPWYVSKVGNITLARLEGAEHNGEWRFSRETVAKIPDLFKEFEGKPLAEGLEQKRLQFWQNPRLWLRERVPAALKQTHFVWIEDWQWLALPLILLIGWLVHRLMLPVLRLIMRLIARTRHAQIAPHTLKAAVHPLGLLVMMLAWWVGLRLLGLSDSAQAVFLGTLKFLSTGVAVWAAYRLIDLIMERMAARAAATASRMDDVLVPLVRKTLKIAVIAVGVIFLVKAVGGSINTLLAGVGLGGLAIGLAAQDTLKNFFGSVNVVLDRPFQVGDWVKIGNTEGTVETVGLRSSRIRTFYNSQVTVPNSEIMNAIIDNMGRRRFRRISTKLGVTYETPPERLEAFCEGIRELIRTHPYTRKDYFHVYVNEFADSSINILLYCFHECPDWGTELRERHRLFLDIVRLAQRLGVDLAFPTQTVHLHHESTPDTPPPKLPTVPAEPDRAQQHGREQADAIVRELLGDNAKKPPPVSY